MRRMVGPEAAKDPAPHFQKTRVAIKQKVAEYDPLEASSLGPLLRPRKTSEPGGKSSISAGGACTCCNC